MKKWAFLALALCATFAQAAVTITVDRVRQRYPWNGCVDIDYVIAGYPETGPGSDPADYVVSFGLSATIGGVKRTIVPTNFASHVICDLPTLAGTNRVTWNASADGWKFAAADLAATAELRYAPVTESEADFMTVDLSGGPDAAAYPARLIRGYTNETAIFNIRPYKTGRLVFRKVRKGDFWMGWCNTETANIGTNMSERHCVRLTKDYYMALFETTIGQAAHVIGSEATRWYSGKGYSLLDTLPLRQISCAQHATASAKAVYDKLNDKARLRGSAVTGFNLPTEAQWELAARAGVTTICMWGDSWNEAEAHARGNCYGTATLAEVGMFPPNDWGFYDMIGNVSEWTCERYVSLYYDYGDAENPVVDPKTASSSTTYYIRGGAYSQTTWTYFTPGYRASQFSYADGSALVGFRLCRVVGE